MANNKKKRKGASAPALREVPDAKAHAAARRAEREARREAERREQRRASVRRKLAAATAATVVVVVVAGIVLFDRQRQEALEADLTSGSCATDRRSDSTGPPGRNHVARPTYQVQPPAGGDHEASAARAGSYEGASVPTDGQLVHSLEHGYVVLWHRPDLPDGDQRELDLLRESHPGDVITVEREGVTAVVATAWGRRLLCTDIEPSALERFVVAYVGRGPEDVERG